MPFDLINPKGLESPVGYAHIAKITGGTTIHIAGQAPFDANGQVVGKGNFLAQFSHVMSNLETAIEAVGGRVRTSIEIREAYWGNKKPLGTGLAQRNVSTIRTAWSKYPESL